MQSLERYGGKDRFADDIERLIEGIKRRQLYHSYIESSFSVSIRDATDADIRARRTKGKRREHIYNYERRKTQDLWAATVKKDGVHILTYHNEGTRVEINAALPPVVRYVVITAFYRNWPDAKITVRDRDEATGGKTQREVLERLVWGDPGEAVYVFRGTTL